MQKFIFQIRSRGFFLLVIAFLIIAGLVYAQATEQFDRSVILHFQSGAGNAPPDLSMWILTEVGGIIPTMIFCFVLMSTIKLLKHLLVEIWILDTAQLQK